MIIFMLEKLKPDCFSFLSQIFPCFLSLFHMFVDTMIVSFNQSFHGLLTIWQFQIFAMTLQVQKLAHENDVKLPFNYSRT